MAPSWNMKNWDTGRPLTFLEALGFSKAQFTFPQLKPMLPGLSASSQHPIGVSGGNSSGTGHGTPQKNVGPGMKNFATGVLNGIGAPVTAANIRSIEAWAVREGGGGTNNPLNTTQQMPGSTNFNSVGVQNYSSWTQGVNATVDTLENGNYADLVAAFKSGKGLLGRSFSGLSTWSGGGYNSVG